MSGPLCQFKSEPEVSRSVTSDQVRGRPPHPDACDMHAEVVKEVNVIT